MEPQYETPLLCPICENPGPFPLSGSVKKIRLLGGRVTYVRCVRCGGEFHSPMWTPETMDWWYSSGTYLRAIKGGVSPERALPVNTKRALLLKAIGVVSFARFLEFGSGEGYLLKEMRRLYGAEAVGIEKDPGRHAGMAATNDPQGQFNVIAAIHSLEHVGRPLETLRWLVSMLAPGGLVLIEVPTTGGKYCESHPIAFTQDSLAMMAKLAGLEMIAEGLAGLVGGVYAVYGRSNGEPSGAADEEDG